VAAYVETRAPDLQAALDAGRLEIDPFAGRDGGSMRQIRTAGISFVSSGIGKVCSGPRHFLAVRTPPGGWRHTEGLLKGSGERRLRIVAHSIGNLRDGRAGVAKLLGRDLHAPISEIIHRRHAD